MKRIDPKKFIEIPADKLADAVKAAYTLSVPIGMGHLHYRQGPLDEGTLKDILSHEHYGDVAVHLDYVHGRCCKFVVFKDEAGKLFIAPDWYDHSEPELVSLLTTIGIENAQELVDSANEARRVDA